MALGGSTNAVLHLIAMARSAGVEVTLDDFQVADTQCSTTNSCWICSGNCHAHFYTGTLKEPKGRRFASALISLRSSSVPPRHSPLCGPALQARGTLPAWRS